MTSTMTQAEKIALVVKMLEGWEQPLDPGLKSITMKGTEVTPEALRARLRDLLFALKEPDRIYALYLDAVAKRRLAEAADAKFMADLSIVVTYQFGEAVAQQRFGVEPEKERSQPSVETKVLANYKRQQTREARGIMGKRQRAAIAAGPQPVITVTERLPDEARALPAAAPSPLRALPPKPDEPAK